MRRENLVAIVNFNICFNLTSSSKLQYIWDYENEQFNLIIYWKILKLTWNSPGSADISFQKFSRGRDVNLNINGYLADI